MHNERRRGRRHGHHTTKYLRAAAGIGHGTAIKYLRRSTGGASGNGLCTTTKYLRGAAGIGLGTTAKYHRRGASQAGQFYAGMQRQIGYRGLNRIRIGHGPPYSHGSLAEAQRAGGRSALTPPAQRGDFVKVIGLMKHMIDESEAFFKGTEAESNFFVFHDGLGQWNTPEA
jgi:hypothetical protein